MNSSLSLTNSSSMPANFSANIVNASSGLGNTSFKFTEAPKLKMHGRYVPIWIFVGTLIIILNVVGIVLFRRSRTIVKNLEVYITSLMACDLLIGVNLLFGPFVFWISKSLIFVDQAALFVRTMLLVSILHTAGLSVDRLLSVKLPNVYTFWVTSRICTLVCLCIWASLMVYHILMFVLATNSPLSGQFDMKSYGLFLIVYVSCLLVYLISSKSIISCAKDHLKRIKSNAPLQEQQKSNTFRLSIVITTASGFLYILYLPAQILGALTLVDPSLEMKVTRLFMDISYPLITLESLLNPLLYLLKFKETRQMIIRVFCPARILTIVSNLTSETSAQSLKQRKEVLNKTATYLFIGIWKDEIL